jgi:hypothetical protein
MTDPFIEICLAALRPTPWRRSRRGNLWRRLEDGRIATIFLRHGCYRWVIMDEGRSTYSKEYYGSIPQAKAALNKTLESII